MSKHQNLKNSVDIYIYVYILCASYQIVSHPVVYVNACKQPTVLLAHTQGKSNLR